MFMHLHRQACIPGPMVGRVRPELTTPLDHLLSGFAGWFQEMWLLWLGIVGAVVVLIVIVSIVKARERAHARVPHYRRDTGPIAVVPRRRTDGRSPVS